MPRLEDQDRMCSGGGQFVEWENAGEHAIGEWDAKMGMRPEGVKRKRVKCPECKRRLMTSVQACDDGCCVGHSIPPHKPKGWWK